MNTTSMGLVPTASDARMPSLDLLRGVAVLGILIMNVQFFAMIHAAYFNPTSFGDLTGLNYAAWWFAHVFADQKFMTIFSALFGAGIVLMGERVEARGGSPAWLHYKRTFWLLAFGAAHAYLLWYGDILFVYGLCALVVIWFRRRRPVTQFAAGLALLAIGSALYFLAGLSLPNWPPEQYQQALSAWAPSAAKVAEEVAAYQGSWREQMAHRVPTSVEFHTIAFAFWGFWRAAGLMLIGMALYRWGLFSAKLSAGAYRRLMVLGFGVGLPLVLYGWHQHEARGWDYDYSYFLGSQYNYWGSLFVSLAYVCVVMLWFGSGSLPALAKRLVAVGRMAFSNYILQTLILTTIFYGHGFGWFGGPTRWQQLLIMLGVWTVSLLVSPWWLGRYRFGPLEWLWRSLTYASWQPLRKPFVGVG